MENNHHAENAMNMHADAVIVGAGLVGLAAAIGMHEAGYKVFLVDEKKPKVVIDPNEWDSRIYAISPRNAQWLAAIGVWQLLDLARIVEMQGMHIWNEQTDVPLTLLAEDAHEDGLGYILEASALMNAMLKKIETLGITTLFNVHCTALNVNQASPVNLILENTDVEHGNAKPTISVHATLLLAADGSQSWVRKQCNFAVNQKAYGHTAVVANFKVQKSHHNIARQWFQQDAENQLAILAWLPLPENVISIVWSASPTFAVELLALSPSHFAERVAAAGKYLLGDFTLLNTAHHFPLQLQTVERCVQDSVVLLGDAAHVVHPMAGQGVNLGFRDVENLIETLNIKNSYQAINDPQLLKQFVRDRKVDVAKMVMLTDGLYHLFNNQTHLIKKVRHFGFEATKLQYLKELLVNQAVNM